MRLLKRTKRILVSLCFVYVALVLAVNRCLHVVHDLQDSDEPSIRPQVSHGTCSKYLSTLASFANAKLSRTAVNLNILPFFSRYREKAWFVEKTLDSMCVQLHVCDQTLK